MFVETRARACRGLFVVQPPMTETGSAASSAGARIASARRSGATRSASRCGLSALIDVPGGTALDDVVALPADGRTATISCDDAVVAAGSACSCARARGGPDAARAAARGRARPSSGAVGRRGESRGVVEDSRRGGGSLMPMRRAVRRGPRRRRRRSSLSVLACPLSRGRMLVRLGQRDVGRHRRRGGRGPGGHAGAAARPGGAERLHRARLAGA